MNPPVVAIVGRPNVGKSTLFNALARMRIAIVEQTSGVTRDRLSTPLTSPDGTQLELVDTGGMGLGARDILAEDIERQIHYAVNAAHALVLVVDGSKGVIPQDREIAARLRTLSKPLVLVDNKVDAAASAAAAAEFHQLGLGEPMLVSALHKRNTGELRDKLFALAAGTGPVEPKPVETKIAIVGRRNVGKSTFINALANEERMIVSELPGTTRDAVDVRFEKNGKTFVAIDTAGLRKKRQTRDSIQFYGRLRTESSIRRAHVVLLMLDPRSEVSRVDKKVAAYICGCFKPCIIVVNKWDLVQDVPTSKYVNYISAELPALSSAPISFVSALQNQRVQSTLDLARSLWKQARVRVQTSDLNNAIEELKTQPQRAGRTGKRPKIYYGTQVDTAPPTIVLFVNYPDYFRQNHRRFISNFLRSRLPFSEIPIDVKYRQTHQRKN